MYQDMQQGSLNIPTYLRINMMQVSLFACVCNIDLVRLFQGNETTRARDIKIDIL